MEAKVNLHRKTERKDLLTEHLYTIIRENELRKAKKLEELIAKLNVSPDDSAYVQQPGLLEAGNDASGTKQNDAEISLSQEKANIENKGLDSEASDSQVSCQVDTVAGTTASKETKADDIVKDVVTAGLARNEATVTS